MENYQKRACSWKDYFSTHPTQNPTKKSPILKNRCANSNTHARLFQTSSNITLLTMAKRVVRAGGEDVAVNEDDRGVNDSSSKLK